MSADGPVSIEHGGFTVTSVGGGRSEDDLREEFTERDKPAEETEEKSEDEKVSEAASELGKKGGKAAAKAKKKAAQEAKKAEEETAEETEPEDSEEEDEGEAARKKVAKEIEEAEPHKKRRLASERVAEATREAAAAKRELEATKRRLENLERQVKAQQAPREVGPAPDSKQYEGKQDEYIEARIQHGLEQALENRRREQARAAAQAHRESWIQERESRLASSFQEAVKEDPELAEKLIPEILEPPPWYKLQPGETPEAKNFIIAELAEVDNPVEVALYLSENPEQYRLLAESRTPQEITRRVARIEALLSVPTGTPVQERKVSKAPPPVKPVSGAPHTVESGYKPGMSFDEYLRSDKLGKELLARSRR